MIDDLNQEHESENQEISPEEINNGLESKLTQKFEKERALLDQVIKECEKVVVGQEEMLTLMLASTLCNGHVLLEGVPGVAKTLSAKVMAKTINADFSRIQFTPDLMPTDIIGTSVFNSKDGSFTFKKGPIFSNIILIDEINRAPAKTQSALFEVMEERQITYDGIEYQMDEPFLVIATQNPVEQEGTYQLPEAQLDRFLMKIVVDYPTIEEENIILQRFNKDIGKIDLSQLSSVLTPMHIKELQTAILDIHVGEDMVKYILQIVHETRQHQDIYLGASPRASLAIMRVAKVIAFMAGRSFITPDDIQYVAPHIMNHRIILTPEAEINGLSTSQVIKNILKEVEVPR